MKQYIDKATVIAEIDKIMYIDKAAVIAEIDKIMPQRAYERETLHSEFIRGQRVAYNKVLSILNTIEAKEVDLKKEIDDFMAKEWDGVEEDEPLYSMIKNDLTDVAEHFFELGLKAQKL